MINGKIYEKERELSFFGCERIFIFSYPLLRSTFLLLFELFTQDSLFSAQLHCY